MLEAIRWQHVDELKKNAPQLKWERSLAMAGTYLAMRVDTKPFDDIRVRRALNMAINKDEIIKAYYGGNAEMFAFPQHPDYGGYFEPLSSDARLGEGALHLQPAKGQEAAGRGGLPERLHLQDCSCPPRRPTTWT